MNPELLQTVKNLKLQGHSDQEITNSLAANYTSTDIDKCLESLRYMQPISTQATEQQNQSEPQSNVVSGSNKAVIKHKFMIGLVAVIAIVFFATPFVLRFTKSQTVHNLDAILVSKYGVDKSYNAGSVVDCVEQGPTKFGQVTGISVCDLITAKVYYPRVKVAKVTEITNINGKQVPDTFDTIDYVNMKGASLTGLNGYIFIGMLIAQPGSTNKYTVDYKLGLKRFDHVVFSGLESQAVPSGAHTIDGKWNWGSESSWLGNDSPGSALQADITHKILSNVPPARGAPTATAALKLGTAPVVAFFITRYCHNPGLPILDSMCILPN